MPDQEVTVNSRKYDLSIRRTWQCRLIEQRDNLMVFVGEFDRDIEHPDLGSISAGTISYEYYWLDRWYNVFRFHNPDDSFRNYYCNINMPPAFGNGVLDYVDLDIDVLVWPDWTTTILDKDEFEANSQLFEYPQTVVSAAEKALSDLLDLIKTRQFPFDN
jgi:protein associated with RNAse G/E